jgi:hypothetical protein
MQLKRTLVGGIGLLALLAAFLRPEPPVANASVPTATKKAAPRPTIKWTSRDKTAAAPPPAPVVKPDVEEEVVLEAKSPDFRRAMAAAEIADADVVTCDLGTATAGDNYAAVPDTQDAGHQVLPWVFHTTSRGGRVTFAAPTDATGAVLQDETGAKTRIMWERGSDGVMRCTSIDATIAKTGLHGHVRVDGEHVHGTLLVQGCGGITTVEPDGSFFLSVDAQTCSLQAMIAGDAGVPHYGDAVTVHPREGQDLSGIRLDIDVPDADWSGLAETLLDWIDNAEVWWDQEPRPDLSEGAQQMQASLNEQAESIYAAVAEKAAEVLADPAAEDALSREQRQALQSFVDTWLQD